MSATEAGAQAGTPLPPRLFQAGRHAARICNACRYCEGLCPVFPAIERRLDFAEADLRYLANLCHDCGACLDACQYAPPHPFGVDVPRTLAAVRRASYRRYAWPARASALFARSGLALLLGAAAAPLLFAVVLGLLTGPDVFLGRHPDAAGGFYRVMPHNAMVALFGAVGAYAAVALAVGLVRCWRDLAALPAGGAPGGAAPDAVHEALLLPHLGDDGDPEEPHWRRRWHHCTFYGFLLCFAATSVAAFYHNVLGWPAPYPLLSVPALLGSLGGAGLLVGPAGLLWLKLRRPAERHDQAQLGMDIVLLVLLFETSLSGLLLRAWGATAAMGPLLGIHLGAVAGLFLLLPYGKFVHGLYRFLALLRYRMGA